MRSSETPEPNYEAAKLYLREAEAAHKRGDHKTAAAAIKLIAVALNYEERTPTRRS